MAIRPLVAAGITPHFAVAADASQSTAPRLCELPSSIDTWLVAEGSIPPESLEEFAGRTFFVCDRLTAAGTCSAHAERPFLCEGYPWYGSAPRRELLVVTPCGYERDLSRSPKAGRQTVADAVGVGSVDR